MSHAVLAVAVDVATRDLYRLARRNARLEVPVKLRDTADNLAHIKHRANYGGVVWPEILDLLVQYLRTFAAEQECRNVVEKV